MIKLLVNNTAGNRVEKTATVTVDNTAPSVSIKSPGAGAQLTGTATIEFEASDPNLDLAQLIIDYNVFIVTGKTLYEWDTTGFGDGTHTVKLVAYDKASNSAATKITVTTVNVKPEVETTISLYIGIGIGMPIGLILGAIVAYMLARRRLKPLSVPP